jgi:hypothetical protein
MMKHEALGKLVAAGHVKFLRAEGSEDDMAEFTKRLMDIGVVISSARVPNGETTCYEFWLPSRHVDRRKLEQAAELMARDEKIAFSRAG